MGKKPTNRTEYLRVRLTRSERVAIEKAAELDGVRVSEYVRGALRASLGATQFSPSSITSLPTVPTSP